MAAPLIRKLEQFTKLTDEDKQTLRDSISEVVDYDAHTDIISQGERPSRLHLLLDGWAARYKLLSEGKRHIMAYLIPGDVCDLHVALLKAMDHSIGTLSRCKVAFITDVAMSKILDSNGRLAKALWWATLVDEAITREWLVTIGAREADKRIGHLLCEMLFRSKAVGLSDDDSFEMPLTQQELGDMMGLSNVHVNRMLQKLRSQGLITIKGKHVEIKDLPALMEFAEFDPIYLHQVREAVRISN